MKFLQVLTLTSFALIGITFTLLVLGVFIIIITTNIITMIT